MNRTHYITLIIGFLLLPLIGLSQKEVSYTIKGKHIIAKIDKSINEVKIDSILESFGFVDPNNMEAKPSTGWLFYQEDEHYIQLLFNKNNETKELPPSFVIKEAEVVEVPILLDAVYGVNKFRSKPTVTTEEGVTRFVLKGNLDAKEVYLSGNFNGWSTLKSPMTKTKSGWECKLNLPPGKYLYKFITNGYWQYDEQNRLKENDLNGSYNSVYYVYNYQFKLDRYKNAKKVYVAGSFNNWEKLKMVNNAITQQWELNLFIKKGTHAYKFVVDGHWITDPANAITRDDGQGNKNSFTSVGDTFYFRLPGYQKAQRVTVAGEFNVWNWDELKMYKSSKGWIIPYVLDPGNYEYKFKVDGQYVLDPRNEITVGSGDYINSVKCIEPNKTFILRGNPNAKMVRLTGSFNGWNTSGYTMTLVEGVWMIRIYLPPGKHTYKFIVDDQWIIDPDNNLWENNEYNTKNSVLWVE